MVRRAGGISGWVMGVVNEGIGLFRGSGGGGIRSSLGTGGGGKVGTWALLGAGTEVTSKVNRLIPAIG